MLSTIGASNPIWRRLVPKLTEERAVAALAREEEDFDLATLYHPRQSYTPQQKMQAAMAYVTTGSVTSAARHCPQVGMKTISHWKNKAAWWPEAVQHCRKMKSEELDGLLTNIIHSCNDAILDRLTNGDIHVSTKDGSVYRAPISVSKLATVMGIAWDKRNMQRGEYSHKSGESTTAQLEMLKAKFEEFSKEQQAKRTHESDGVMVIEKTIFQNDEGTKKATH